MDRQAWWATQFIGSQRAGEYYGCFLNPLLSQPTEGCMHFQRDTGTIKDIRKSFWPGKAILPRKEGTLQGLVKQSVAVTNAVMLNQWQQEFVHLLHLPDEMKILSLPFLLPTKGVQASPSTFPRALWDLFCNCLIGSSRVLWYRKWKKNYKDYRKAAKDKRCMNCG